MRPVIANDEHHIDGVLHLVVIGEILIVTKGVQIVLHHAQEGLEVKPI